MVGAVVVLAGWTALALSGTARLPVLVWILGYLLIAAIGVAGAIACPYLVVVDDQGVRRTGVDGGCLRWSQIEDLWLLPTRQNHLVLIPRAEPAGGHDRPGDSRAIRSERIFVAASVPRGSLIVQAGPQARQAIESGCGKVARPNNTTGLRRKRV